MSRPFYAAWLRVHTPLDALPAAERDRWRGYLEASTPPGRRAAARLEHEAALVALARASLQLPGWAGGQALVERIDGVTHVCPLQLQRRVWQAAVLARRGLPDLLADALLPRDQARAAAEALAETGDRPVHVRSSLWTVPLAWFALVRAEERRADDEGVRYLAEVRRAAQRAQRALSVLQRTVPGAPTVAVLAELVRWLARFPAGSRLELDYGTVADLVDPQLLRADPSPGDLAEALAELGAGRASAAAIAYERVLSRWRPLQQRENAS